MNPDDEPEDGHGAPQPPREEGAAELGPAPRAYVPPKNMYAMGVEEPDVAHADAEVAEGEPEDGEYVDAELEQHQAAPALRYESEASTDDEDAAGHTGESGVQPDEEQWGAAEADADADAPALEGDDQTATMAHQASEAAEEDNDVDGDDEDDEDDEDDDDDGDDDSDDDEDDDSDDDDGDKSEDDDDDGEVDDDEAEDGLGEGQQEYAQEEYAQEELPQEVYADAAPEEIEHTVAAFAQQTDEPDAPGALYEPTPSPAVAPPPPPQQRPQQQRPQQQRPQQQPRQQPQREQKQQPPRQPPVRQRRVAPAQDDDGFLFGAPDIPMPPARRRIDKQRARDARANLDLDLGRIKRIKRFGLVITTATVLFVAFVLAPVTWVGAYLFFDPPANVLMMQRAAEGETIRHRPVPLNRMSPHMVRAVIAAEDANFCAHDGFDVEAIQGAMQANARGGRTRGASTVSQQTAKNLFLWPDRSWLRKGLETYFTALVEFMWPKRRIMEAYLNTAEWGDGIFGVEAAARARFGVSAADLTPLQAARLAAVLPNPNRWRADAPGPYVRQRSAALVGRARVVRDERLAACVLNLDRPG